MLRPASLLPPWRLLTPCFGDGGLPPSRRFATGRSGAYPDGTCTRWNLRAGNRSSPRSLVGSFRTHRVSSLPTALTAGNPLASHA